MFFAFNSPKFNQLTHLQLQYVVLLPLIFALVITFAKRVETIDQRKAAWLLSLAAVCLNVQLATTFYYAWYFILWTILFLLLALAFRGSRSFIIANAWKFRRALAIGAAVFLIGFIPILLIYLPTVRVGTWYRFDFVMEMIPDWRALLSMGDGNFVWGWFYKRLVGDPRPSTWGELMVGIGLVPSLAWIALTVASVWFIKKGRSGHTGQVPLFLGVMILATSIFIVLGRQSWRSLAVAIHLSILSRSRRDSSSLTLRDLSDSADVDRVCVWTAKGASVCCGQASVDCRGVAGRCLRCV